MAMQKVHVIKDTNTKQITALGYNPLKHEILAGCEGKMFFCSCYVWLGFFERNRFISNRLAVVVVLTLFQKSKL